MKLNTATQIVERSGVSAEGQFNIKTSAHAFDILSSGLYTDSILAIVRELATNAYDAHVAAGNPDVPFEIHVPNALEPWFHVKDFGIGLSHDDVMTLYSTYFESTKSTSNDFIGALGLGSKSPFSYTKSFIVISRFDQVRRTYSVFVNEQGVPSIALMNEVATTEPNGLEIKINVKPSDFSTFVNKIQRVCLWFKTPPTIVGIHSFILPEIVPVIQGTGWKLVKSIGEFGNNTSVLSVQGCVAYATNLSTALINHFGSTLTPQDSAKYSIVTDRYNVFMSRQHLILDFNIGELEVAANREELRYDKRTSKAIVDRLDVVINEIIDNLEQQTNNHRKDKWSRFAYLNHKFGYGRFASNEIRSRVDPTKHPILTEFCAQNGKITLTSPVGHTVTTHSYRSATRITSTEHSYNDVIQPKPIVGPKPTYAIMYDDVKTGGKSRVRNYILNDSSAPTSVLLIRRIKDAIRTEVDPATNEKKAIFLTEKDYQEEYESILDTIGVDRADVEFVSTKTQKIKRSAVSKNVVSNSTNFSAYSINRTRTHNRSYENVKWDLVELTPHQLSEGGFYFPLRNGSKMIHNSVDSVIELEFQGPVGMSRIEYMQSLVVGSGQYDLDPKYGSLPIIGVGPKGLKEISRHPKWFNLSNMFLNIIPNYIDAINYNNSVKFTNDLLKNGNAVQLFKEWDHLRRLIPTLDSNSEFRIEMEKFLATCRKYEGINVDSIRAICRQYRYELPVQTGQTSLLDVSRLAKYKMFMLLIDDMWTHSKWMTPNYTNEIIQYIKMVDRS